MRFPRVEHLLLPPLSLVFGGRQFCRTTAQRRWRRCASWQNFGIRIALDDFGTGYSSLSYLRSFPFDKIKIDRSFINGLSDGSTEAVAIVRAMTQIGLSLGMSTTAEGVETVAQRDIIRAAGCTEVQGYLYSLPKPAHEIAKMIARDAAADATVDTASAA